MGKLIEAMERFERDYVKPPIMTTREAKDNVWLYNQLPQNIQAIYVQQQKLHDFH